jgi:hypothetical protein
MIKRAGGRKEIDWNYDTSYDWHTIKPGILEALLPIWDANRYRIRPLPLRHHSVPHQPSYLLRPRHDTWPQL